MRFALTSQAWLDAFQSVSSLFDCTRYVQTLTAVVLRCWLLLLEQHPWAASAHRNSPLFPFTKILALLQGHCRAAAALLAQKQQEKAIAAYRKAIDLDSSCQAALQALQNLVLK